MKLNQLIAIITGEKTQTQKKITELYKKIQHSDLFSGISRTYRPKDDEGDQLPPESKQVQLKNEQVLDEAEKIYSELWDLILAQDDANRYANANLVVDDQTILENLPVTYLMFLEKQLIDLRTLVDKIPELDPAEEWKKSDAQGVYAGPIETLKTKKIPKNHVKAEATKEHPAQVEVYHEDVVIGTWSTLKFSGAMVPSVKNNMLKRIENLIKATKVAREEANSKELDFVSGTTKVIFEYIRAQV